MPIKPTLFKPKNWKPNDSRSRESSEYRKLYGYRWQKARLLFLQHNPLCVMCLQEGLTTAADVVDHVVPHQGNEVLFWDNSNWQALCKRHHDSDKQKMERGMSKV